MIHLLPSITQLWYNGLITFDLETVQFAETLYSPDFVDIPLSGDLMDFSFVSPYWARDDESSAGTFAEEGLYYGNITYEIHTRADETEELETVNEYINANFEIPVGFTFTATWMLIVQWDICDFRDERGVSTINAPVNGSTRLCIQILRGNCIFTELCQYLIQC